MKKLAHPRIVCVLPLDRVLYNAFKKKFKSRGVSPALRIIIEKIVSGEIVI